MGRASPGGLPPPQPGGGRLGRSRRGMLLVLVAALLLVAAVAWIESAGPTASPSPQRSGTMAWPRRLAAAGSWTQMTSDRLPQEADKHQMPHVPPRHQQQQQQPPMQRLSEPATAAAATTAPSPSPTLSVPPPQSSPPQQPPPPPPAPPRQASFPNSRSSNSGKSDSAAASPAGPGLPREWQHSRARRMCHQACLRENVGMIYFLHMRKAGGTSLSGVLNQRMISGTASGQPGAFGNASFVEFLLEFMIQSGFQPATDCERVAKGSAERTAGAQCVSKAANVLGQRALRKNIFMTKVVVGGEDPSGRALGRLRHNQFPPADPRLEHAGITYFWNEGQPFIMPMLAENSFPTVSLTHLRNPVSRIISNYKMVFSACRSHEFNNSDTSAECPPPGRRSLGGWVGWRREADAECADRVESLFEYQQAWLASRKEGGAEQLSERQAFLLASLGEGLRLPKAAELVWTVVDNYYIRRLIVAGRGPDLDLPTVARLLRGQVTRADLALAKEVLQQFDVIFISDPQLGTPEEEAQFEEAIGPILFKPNADRQTIVRQSKSDRQARSVLEQFPYKSFPADGWEQKVSSFARNMARTGGRNEDPKLLQRIEKMQDVNNASVLADLARINALDMELFEYARQLVQERAAAGKEKHFLPPQPGGERTDDVPSWCDYSSRDDSARCNFRWPAEARNGAIAQSPWLVAPMGIH